MPKPDFTHVTTWVFDLDNTLYPPHMRLFDQIEEPMLNYGIGNRDERRDRKQRRDDACSEIHALSPFGPS